MTNNPSPWRKALQKKAILFCLSGLVLQLATPPLLAMAQSRGGSLEIAIVVLVTSLAGFACWIAGLLAYAESKGYSAWWSLLGLLSGCGLLVLIALPDQWNDGSASRS